MAKADETKQPGDTPKQPDRGTSLPVLVRVTRADRLRVAALLSTRQ